MTPPILKHILGLIWGKEGHCVYQNSVSILSADRLGYFQFSVQNWQKLQEFSTAEDVAMLEDAREGEHCRFTVLPQERQIGCAIVYR